MAGKVKILPLETAEKILRLAEDFENFRDAHASGAFDHQDLYELLHWAVDEYRAGLGGYKWKGGCTCQ